MEADAEWKRIMGNEEPLDFTSIEHFLESCSTSCAHITCVVCFIQLDVKWYHIDYSYDSHLPNGNITGMTLLNFVCITTLPYNATGVTRFSV